MAICLWRADALAVSSAALAGLKGTGGNAATWLPHAVFDRAFRNRCELAGRAGPAPTPWASGGVPRRRLVRLLRPRRGAPSRPHRPRPGRIRSSRSGCPQRPRRLPAAGRVRTDVPPGCRSTRRTPRPARCNPGGAPPRASRRRPTSACGTSAARPRRTLFPGALPPGSGYGWGCAHMRGRARAAHSGTCARRVSLMQPPVGAHPRRVAVGVCGGTRYA